MERVYEVLTDPYISGIIVFIITWPLSNWLTKRVNIKVNITRGSIVLIPI